MSRASLPVPRHSHARFYRVPGQGQYPPLQPTGLGSIVLIMFYFFAIPAFLLLALLVAALFLGLQGYMGPRKDGRTLKE